MKQLQIISPLRLGNGRNLGQIKLAVISLCYTILKLAFRKIRQKTAHHRIGHLLVAHVRQLLHTYGKGRNRLRHKQAPILRQALKNCLGSRHSNLRIPCTLIKQIHPFILFPAYSVYFSKKSYGLSSQTATPNICRRNTGNSLYSSSAVYHTLHRALFPVCYTAVTYPVV